MKRILKYAPVFVTAMATLLLAAPEAQAFCGFYVGKADTKLFNKASQVAIARDGDRTVLTMASDYSGDLEEFALVIPVPTFIRREQIHVADRGLLEHLDAYSAPRLVEYFDPDPCAILEREEAMFKQGNMFPRSAAADEKRSRSLGVSIEARYTVGEYDILILSATQSSGLLTWLRENGYKVPAGAAEVLGSYLRQGMHFFVARVNLAEQQKLGYSYLRPIQVAYESPKFMLPIRLGMVNAKGEQELFVYLLTRKGRVETTNYRTLRLPSDQEVPLFVAQEFGDFYRDLFAHQTRASGGRAVYLEYAWDMAWCDPCAADPLSSKELRQLGAFWVEPVAAAAGGPQSVFLTRLHVRYDQAHFPEDLVFQETADRANFQGRYILRHPFTGEARCEQARTYQKETRARQERQAEALATLTGWDLARIRLKMEKELVVIAQDQPEEPWWRRIWKD